MADDVTTEEDGGTTPISTTGNGQNDEGTSKLFVFPSDVEVSGHFLKLMAFKYSRSWRGQPNARPLKQADIILPMPSNLSTNYRAEYNTGALDFAGKVIEPHLQTAIDNIKQAYASTRAGQNVNVHQVLAEQLKQFGALINTDTLMGYSLYQALDMFENTEIGRVAQLTGGFARNPHLALLFQGVGFRSHVFSYQFIARNMQEAVQLRELLRFLRRAMLPSFNDTFDNHLFNYPYEFEISMSNEAFTFHIGESVLTDLRIDYHATGRPLYFNTEGEVEIGENDQGQTLTATGKPPVAVSVDMEFTETSIVTQEAVLKENR